MLLLLTSLAHADTFWDVTPEQAAAIVAAVQPGDVLLRWCPGCGPEVTVVEVRSLEVLPGTYSDGVSIGMRWKAKAEGFAEGERPFGGGFGCGTKLTCLADPSAECAGREAWLDIPYTWRLEEGGRWVWVGSYAGLEGRPEVVSPMPKVTEKIQACPAVKPAAKRPASEAGD